MTWRIFRGVFAGGMAVLLLCLILFAVTLTAYDEQQVYDDLAAQTEGIARGTELLGLDYLRTLQLPQRITWVGADGTVLYDSAAEAQTMTNHLSRQEIADALAHGYGRSVHQSETLLEKNIYYALRLGDGSVLRVACRADSSAARMLRLVQPMLWVLFLALGLSLWLASYLSRKITRPLNELDLDHPRLKENYPELDPLLGRLRDQNRTIRQQMEQLRRRQREFESVTANMSEGFLLFNLHGAILAGNKSGRDFHARHAAAVRSCAASAAAGQRGRETLRLDGRCYSLLADPVVSAGQVDGAVVIITDDTEREQRERLRREFSANVSHELKTPLTSISGFAELMKSGMVPSEKVPEFAGDIYGEARRLIGLVEDIIRISRLDEGEALPQPEGVELKSLCAGVLERLGPVAEGRGVTLSLSGEESVISGMRRILEDMVDNLVDNAIKYNRPGGTVAVTVTPTARGVELAVSDTGIGIPPVDRERVFERFYRVDKSHSRAIGGTGLGLAIVKHGAQYHNAAIHLDSEEGRGTTITLSFPKEEL